jgi:hypothetical protein
MMCPFTSTFGVVGCIEECALWDDGNKCCCFKSISMELIKINEGIQDASTRTGRREPEC